MAILLLTGVHRPASASPLSGSGRSKTCINESAPQTSHVKIRINTTGETHTSERFGGIVGNTRTTKAMVTIAAITNGSRTARITWDLSDGAIRH